MQDFSLFETMPKGWKSSDGGATDAWNGAMHVLKMENSGTNCISMTGNPLIFYHFHSLSFVSPQVIIPSKHLTNPLTKDILHLCFVPYLNIISTLIHKVRAVSPDFDFGINHGAAIDYRHTFLAGREMRSQIEDSAISQFKIPLDKDWDCYCSEQLVEFSSQIDQINGLLGGGETAKVLSAVMDAMKEFPDAPPLLALQAELEYKGDERIKALERLLKSYPNCARAHSSLGLLYHNKGNKDKALYHYQKAAEFEPQNIIFRKVLADFYYVVSGRTEAALQLYLKIFTVNPADIENLLMLGHICVYLKKFEDAKVFYDKVLRIEPWNRDAKEKVDQLAMRQSPADSRFERSEKTRSNQGAKPEVGGLLLDFGGHKTEAVDRGAGGARIEPAEKLYQNTQELIKNGRDKEGINALKILLKAYPDYALAHNDLGVLHYNQGNKDEALFHYEKAAQLEYDNNTFQKNLADFYYVEAGRMEEALQIYVKLLDANPTDIETLLILGQICASLEKMDDAGVFFNKILELEPWNMDAQERLDELTERQRFDAGGQISEVGAGLGFATNAFGSPDKLYREAQELIKRNREKDAVAILEKLAASYPDHALAQNDLGVLYFNEGNKEKALQHYEKASRLEPLNSLFQKNLADFYYVVLGHTKEALEIYLKILEINPTDVETLLIMGHICVFLKKFDDAKVFYNRTLELEPWNADAREKLDQLAKAQRPEDGGRRTEDSGLWSVVGGQGERDAWTGGGMDEGIETDLGAPVVNEEFPSDSRRFILSLILSSENSERLIRTTGEEEESSGISGQIDIVVGEKSSRQDGRGAIREIQAQSKNIIYVETGESYPQDAVDVLKFVAKRVNDSRNASDIKRELAEVSSSTGIPTLDPDKADHFISLFERLSDALKELTEPFRASSVSPEELVAGEKVEARKGLDASDDAHRQKILSRIVKMKNEKGLGWKDISEVFNSEGLPTFSGKGKWHRKTIYKMYQKMTK